MVPFYRRKKMEILKLFNDWPKSPEKDMSEINKCESNFEVEEENIIYTDSIINELNQENLEKEAKIIDLENTIKKMEDIEKTYKQEIEYIKSERDKFKEESELSASYLKNVEFSFNDVHSKYERTKGLIQELKQNEINLQKHIRLDEDAIEMLIQQYSTLKNYTTQQFEEANNYMKNLIQEKDCILEQLQSKVRKLEITTVSLEQSLQQKTIENEQLSIICDELINKQSGYYCPVKEIVQTK